MLWLNSQKPTNDYVQKKKWEISYSKLATANKEDRGMCGNIRSSLEILQAGYTVSQSQPSPDLHFTSKLLGPTHSKLASAYNEA